MITRNKGLIKNLWESKGYDAQRMIQKFPDKNLKGRGIENLLRKLQETGSLDHLMGNGKPRNRAAVWCSLKQSLIVVTNDTVDQWHTCIRACA